MDNIHKPWIVFNGFFWILYLLWFAGISTYVKIPNAVILVLLSLITAYYAYKISNKVWAIILGILCLAGFVKFLVFGFVPLVVYIAIFVIYKKRVKVVTPLPTK